MFDETLTDNQTTQPERVIVYHSQSEALVDAYVSEHPVVLLVPAVLFLLFFFYVGRRVWKSQRMFDNMWPGAGGSGRNGVAGKRSRLGL